MVQRGDNITSQQHRALLSGVHELSCLDGVKDIYAHATRDLFGDDWQACGCHRQGRAALRYGALAPEVPADLYQLLQSRATENPLPGTLQGDDGACGSMTWRDAIGCAEGHEDLPSHHDFYKTLGIDNQSGLWGFEADGSIVTNSSSRCGDDRPDEKVLLSMLRPHLLNAYRTGKSPMALEHKPDWLLAGLEELQAGLIALAPAGHITRATPQAVALLDTHFSGVGRPPDRLPAALDRWVRRALPKDGRSLVPPAPYVCPPPGNRAQGGLTVRLTHGPDEGYLLIFQPLDRKPTADELMQRWGLSRRRAEVLALMTAGMDNPQIAKTLHLCVATVRKHLEHIYHQLGVNSRTEAVTQALRGHRDPRN